MTWSWPVRIDHNWIDGACSKEPRWREMSQSEKDGSYRTRHHFAAVLVMLGDCQQATGARILISPTVRHWIVRNAQTDRMRSMRAMAESVWADEIDKKIELWNVSIRSRQIDSDSQKPGCACRARAQRGSGHCQPNRGAFSVSSKPGLLAWQELRVN